jgi:hypothetical protein
MQRWGFTGYAAVPGSARKQMLHEFQLIEGEATS